MKATQLTRQPVDTVDDSAIARAICYVAICCADSELRRSLAAALRAHADILVTGVAHDPTALWRLVDRAAVTVVVGDPPRRGSLSTWRAPGERWLVLCEDSAECLALLQAGAVATLPRSAPPAEIAAAVKAVAAGLAVLPPALLPALLDGDAVTEAANGPAAAPLTPRELEVLAAMADGASNKAIARRLGISFHTAKFHVAAILAKLDADSRTEAVTKAAQRGLVML